MSNLINKSNENIKAADMLIKNSLFTSSIHNCYYAVFQTLLSISKDNGFIEKENKGESSHNRVVNFYKHHIINKEINEEQQRKILSDISLLKKIRVQADYKEKIFNKEWAEKAFCKCEELIKIIMHHEKISGNSKKENN